MCLQVPTGVCTRCGLVDDRCRCDDPGLALARTVLAGLDELDAGGVILPSSVWVPMRAGARLVLDAAGVGR